MITNNIIRTYTNKLKNNYFLLVFYGFVLRLVFSFFGHNSDWPGVKHKIFLLRESYNVYDFESYPYFWTRFFIELPIFNLIDSFNLQIYKFVDYQRIIYFLMLYLIQIIFLNIYKKHIPEKIFIYFHTSLVLAINSGFFNQLDTFVLVVSICILFGLEGEHGRLKMFVHGFLFFFFSSIKPVLAPIVLFIFFIFNLKKVFYFYFGIAISALSSVAVIYLLDGIFPRYNIYWTLRNILTYKGFDNYPLFNFLGFELDILNNLNLNLRLISYSLFILCLSFYLFNLKEKNVKSLIFYYLILYFIFSPTLAQQNIVALFIAINLLNLNIKQYFLNLIEVLTVGYLILLNIYSIMDDTIKNLDYLIFDIYFFLQYHQILLRPSERYFGNFIALAIFILYLSNKKTNNNPI